MAIRPGDVYRGHRRAKTAVTVVVTVLAVLLLSAIILFYSLQKYIVGGPDGISLELPFLSSGQTSGAGEPDTTAPPTDSGLVITAPDFEDADFGAGEGLSAVRAVFVKADGISAQWLIDAASLLEQRDANALVLDMKPESGKLSWSSSARMAQSYGVSGEAELSGAIAGLKEQGVYLVAQLSCCVDKLMAERNTPLTLRREDGSPYADGAGSWLDPYNRDLRSYIFSLIDELYLLGFDEILLTNLAHPHATGLVYSQSAAAQAGIVACISNFARAAAERYAEAGPSISVMLDAVSLRDGLSETTGQDVSSLAKFFDRLYLPTTPEQLESDTALAASDIQGEEVSLRLVPVMSSAPDTGCWLIG